MHLYAPLGEQGKVSCILPVPLQRTPVRASFSPDRNVSSLSFSDFWRRDQRSTGYKRWQDSQTSGGEWSQDSVKKEVSASALLQHDRTSDGQLPLCGSIMSTTIPVQVWRNHTKAYHWLSSFFSHCSSWLHIHLCVVFFYKHNMKWLWSYFTSILPP